MTKRRRSRESFKSFFPKAFLLQVAGASTMGIIESALEVYSPELFGQPNRVSSANPPLGMEPVLPIEKWVTLPVGALMAAVTMKAKSQKVKSFGDGILYYVLPRVAEQEIVRVKQASDRNWAPP